MTRSDTIISLSGAAVALSAGLLLGAAMQPHLDDGDNRPAGPQMFADWAGDRSTGPFDPGTTFVSYRGKIPDYVMGTDWRRRMAWPDEPAAVTATPREDARKDDPPPEAPVLTRATYEDPPAPAHDYPSLGGAPAAASEDASDTPAPAQSDAADPAVRG